MLSKTSLLASVLFLSVPLAGATAAAAAEHAPASATSSQHYRTGVG